MLYEILREYKTKEGDEIEFEYHLDSEREANPRSAWVVHKIDASVGGENVGYLKISYIPKDHMKKFFPSFLNWLNENGSSGIIPYEKQQQHYLTYSKEELIDRFPKVHYDVYGSYPEYNDGKYYYNGKLLTDYTLGEWKETYKLMETALKKRFQKKYDKFVKFHVDKPMVDYIRVHKPRLRIGEALYLAGAKWMHSRGGLRLYGSGLQSELAQFVWRFLESKHNIKTDRDGRRYISVG